VCYCLSCAARPSRWPQRRVCNPSVAWALLLSEGETKAEHDNINTQTLASDHAGGFVVHIEFGAGHVRTFGGLGSENEARECLERSQTSAEASSRRD